MLNVSKLLLHDFIIFYPEILKTDTLSVFRKAIQKLGTLFASYNVYGLAKMGNQWKQC